MVSLYFPVTVEWGRFGATPVTAYPLPGQNALPLLPLPWLARFPVTGLCRDRHRLDEGACGLVNLLDGEVERSLVVLRRGAEPAHLPDKLHGGGPDFLVGGRRIEIEERPYVAALGYSSSSLVWGSPGPWV